MSFMEWLSKFGVPALFGTLIIVGSFVIIGMLVAQNKVDAIILLPMIGSWVGSIVTAVFVVKGMTASKGE